MAEQKCPMCGKLNPPDAEVCQFCQARLKPLIINQPDESQPTESKQPSEALPKEDAAPDWLRSLREPQQEADSETGDEDLSSWPLDTKDESPDRPSGEELADPDWLDSLRDPESSEEDAFMDTTQGDAADETSRDEDVWMPSEPDSEDESSIPDWLSNIRTSSESQDESSEALTEKTGDESPDWLERIRSRQQEEAPDRDIASEQEQDIPDWLRSDDISTAGTMADWPSSIRDREEDASSDELPFWLKQDEVEESRTESDEIPDWMETEDETASSAEEFPEWLETGEPEPIDQETTIEQPDSVAGPTLEGESVEDENIDWLSEPGEGLPEEQAPDWLHSAGDASESEEGTTEPAEASPQAEVQPAEGLPDWLQQDDQASEGSHEELPDWLTEGADVTALPEESPDWLQAEKSTTGPRAELPDWLSETAEETQEGITPDTSAEGLPDWLADLDHEVSADIADAAEEGIDRSIEPAKELPEWLAGIGSETVETGDELSAEVREARITQDDASSEATADEPSAFPDDEGFEEEVPDWLADVKASEEAAEAVANKPEKAKSADLAPAELPSWLEAMRPVEAEADTESLDELDHQVVSAGPLAGLRGVLPAEPEISKVQKPPTYSIKLQVSDMQQERAAMFEELLQSEGVSRPIPRRPLVSSQNLLRIIFALVLFLAILWPLIANGPTAPVPVFSPETAAANQLIAQIKPQAPVLVAVDYQPGLSGEMDAIASTLFDHLMLRGAYLTLVSTTASGPIQAEHVIELANQRFAHSYLGAGEYTNLGYIPGGPTGLISFAANPRAMMAYALDDGRPAWENSPLQDVQNLGEFSLVTVITENPETARAWIEQVQPELDNTPLIMAISAQAEPMVRPYYAAFPKQVQGMVVGIAGSVAYESLMGRQGLALDYWNSFGAGLLVAIALIFIGGSFNMIPIFFKGGRENSTEREGSR